MTRNKTEYHIIETLRHDYGATKSFEDRVVQHLEQGWELVGGVSMVLENDGWPKFAQAVKRVK